MAKAAKKTVEYSKTRPLDRAMMDPYTGLRILPDDEKGIVMDSNKAKFHVEMGEAEYIEEECASPFEKSAPVTEKPHAVEKGKV